MGGLVMMIYSNVTNTYVDDDLERSKFENYIKTNWEKKYHNFSIVDDVYYFGAMQDAWRIWLFARDFVYLTGEVHE
jgi:hypothetical protein